MTDKSTPPTMTLDEWVAKMLAIPAVKAEYDALVEESDLLDEMLAARKSAGLTLEQIAEHMGTTASVITRMERDLVSGKKGPSFATLKKFAKATGKKLQIRFI
ncbi:helix-turn-helix transcriptional regulator [Salmonella enterica]|nr:helix-turn-helix transcriptional regulator [Salmonella enterica]